MKYYKYSRKEWLEYYQDLEHMHITKEAEEDLLATISPEEESQKIMMEQVPKSPLEGIKEIEEISEGDIRCLDSERLIDKLWEKQCEVIRNQNIILKAIKQIINYK